MARVTDRDIKRIADALAALKGVADPLERVDAVRRVREIAERLEHEAVMQARKAGHTWSDIGALIGLTKQGAQQRFRGVTSSAPTAERSTEERSKRPK